jgi:hypothetical protein
MSKTSQRKQSSYDLGYRHGEKYGCSLYIQRPHLGLYRLGVRDGLKGKDRKIVS